MCKSHLFKGLGIMIAVLLCIGAFTPFAGGASQEGVALKICGMPFNQLVTELVKQKGGKKLMLLKDVSTPVDIVVPEATPLDKILANVSSTVGLDFWQDEDTYYIGEKNKQASSNPKPNDQKPIDNADIALMPLPDVQPTLSPIPVNTVVSVNNNQVKQVKPVIASIELQHTSASEMAWMLGVPGTTRPGQNRRRILASRIDTVLNPRKPQVYQQAGDSYSSPMLQSSSPWLSGALSRRNGNTDAYQANPFGGVPFGGGGGPFGGAPAGGTGGAFGGGGVAAGAPIGVPAGGAVLPTNNNGTNNNDQNQQLLKEFIPDGVQSIVGIESLNTLLVRATSQEAIDQLADFIKLLDKPTKQAVIEVMFVKMSVTDAMTFGASWSVTGTPWSVNNAGITGGSTTVSYSQGNVRLLLGAMIEQTRARVVNAPRVIVQNGGYATIELSDSIPFVITSEDEDVYGKVTKVPTISTQTFSQGMDVNEILIHPDDSVTLDVYPILEDPTESIAIPGSDNNGSVSGSSTQTIETRVRVKNGETIMMGGFVSNNDKIIERKTPLLSNLPVLGPLLFKSNQSTLNNTETLIFITPTVLKDDPTNFEGMTTLPPLF